MGIALQVVEKVEIGGTGNIGAAGVGLDLEAFQAVVDQFDALERDGRIEITNRHRESQTAYRYVDHLTFRRIA